MSYLNSVVFSNFRPNRIKVSTDEFRQKAEKRVLNQLIKTTYLLIFKTMIIRTKRKKESIFTVNGMSKMSNFTLGYHIV